MTTTLITGLPRSGTNLICACLNTLPNCLALTEPMRVPAHGDRDQAVGEIISFAEATRERILTGRVAPSRTVNGLIADNFFAETPGEDGVRPGLTDLHVTEVSIDKPLSANFRLFIKHPAIFTVLAKPLFARLPLYAVVRHPLAVLGSWQTVDTPTRQGRLPVAEAYAPELRDRLAGMSVALDRQIELLRWHFQIYRWLPRDHVLTYKSVIHDAGAALRPLSGTDAPLGYPVRTLDLKARYSGVDFGALAQALVAIEGEVEPFYPDFLASLRAHLIP